MYTLDGKNLYEDELVWKTMRKGKEKCAMLELEIHWTNGMDRIKPIEIAATLHMDIDSDSNDLTPMVNIFSKTEDRGIIELWKDCGDDNKCQSALRLGNFAAKKVRSSKIRPINWGVW